MRWLVVRQGFSLGVTGVVIGSALALGMTRVLQTMLFGITARDPVTFAAVAVLLALVAVAASYLPGAACDTRRPAQRAPE